MEVKNENSAFLSNLEVLKLLKDLQAGRHKQQKPNKHQQNLGTITYETIKYLERTPCALQNPERVTAFMLAMKDFELTKAEKLQLLNNRPTSMVEMYLMVEEIEERMTEEQMARLMDAIITHLPGPEAKAPPVVAAAATAAEESREVVEEEEGAGGEEVDKEYVAI